MTYLLYLAITVAIVILDQITKYLAVRFLMPIPTFPLIQDVLHLTYVENRGAAFGMLQDHRWVFMVLSTVVMLVILFVMYRFRSYIHPILMTGLSFVVGGGIGNMIDRVVNGFVVDFVDFTLIDFAVFNLADTFICIGVGLMILDILLGKSDISFLEGKKADKDEADGVDNR